jgi:nucleotide-binding universal stress UspA family protein
MQVNRKTMLARVSHYVAPATRRRPNPNAGSTSHAVSASQPLPLDREFTPQSGDVSAPPPPPVAAEASGGAEDAGAPRVLKGKPSQVIQRFVKAHNIDLLVIPVTPQAALRRMARESKRGAPRSDLCMCSTSASGNRSARVLHVLHECKWQYRHMYVPCVATGSCTLPLHRGRSNLPRT